MAVPGKPIDRPSQSSRIPLRRRIAWRCLAVLIAWAGIELGAVAILFLNGSSPPYHRLRDRQQAIAAQQDWVAVATEEVLHPYTGYSLNPDHLQYVNSYGFARMDEDIPHRGPDRLVVGVTGGSVALELCRQGGETLKRKLQEAFPGRSVVLNCMAVQGYRQPQQVMVLTYFQFLGAQFDVVINLDGFNEVALAPTEDPLALTFDAYPRRWASRMNFGYEAPSAVKSASARAAVLRDGRHQFAVNCSRAPWKYSPTILLCWYLRNDKYEADLRHISQEVQQAQEDSVHRLPFVATGPPNSGDDPDERLQHLVDQWHRGSVQLNRICAASGTRYIHILQPNQYVPNSKPILAGEEKFLTETTYGSLVVTGYPLLRESGERLADEQGIQFVDGSMVFQDVSETLYCDACCHLNARGNELLAEFIAAEVVARTDE